MCMESNKVNRAFEDPVLLNDKRVLQNLLSAEDKYVPPSMLFQLCSDGHKTVHEENGVGMDGRGKEMLLHLSQAFCFFFLRKYCFFVTEKCTSIWISGTSVEFDV